MEILENLDLLSVSITTAATLVLGFTIYFSNTKSVTNFTFLIFAVITAMWSMANYFHHTINSVPIAFALIRFVIFLGVWHAFTFFQLFFVFPKENVTFPKNYKYLIIPIVSVASIINLTPLVFKGVAEVIDGRISKIENGPAIALFGLLIVSFIVSGVFLLIKRIITSQGRLKKQFQTILYGVILTFILILTFNFILPAFFNNPSFIPLSSIFIFPFIVFTSYSILKHKFFNIKVAGISLLVFALSIVAFGEVIFARELFLIVYRSSVFVLILIFGILLIKGVMREVSLREQLQEANKAQENLINFITHQIKGFLTKSRNIFAEMMEGTFGPISGDIKNIAEQGLKINTDGVNTVQTILNAANIRTGKLSYNMAPIDLRDIIQKSFEKNRKSAESKGLNFVLNIGESSEYKIKGDENQLSEAFSNLIDNSIKYTPRGQVKVSLVKSDNKIRFSVKDTGIGIAPEDKPKLFTEGGRAKNALEVNVDSTGFGLYIVKNIIEAHNGRVWVESEGEGKGSEFIVEVPTSA